MTKSKAKKYYLTNNELYPEIMKSKELDQLTNKAVGYLYKMIERISRPLPYVDQELKRDVQSGAMLTVCKNWRKYDETKSKNAFGFFTSVIINGLAQHYNEYSPSTKEGDIIIRLESLFANTEEQNN